ncbi:MAG: transglutaminase domain-containing protein [Desulfosporosinus sp.]|nr:transglutaminase domain-containing protein [Desulfosporosinus sp.]
MEKDDFAKSDWFLRFPHGCCGDTSNLLSRFLRDNGISTEYVSGFRGNQSHAWLEYDNLIIDITAYQFPEIKEEVLVTRDKSWHDKFKRQERSDGDFERFESYNRNRLSSMYANILRKISSKEQVN